MMKQLLFIGLLNAAPLFGQWYASGGMEQQVYSSSRLQSPANPVIDLGYAAGESKLSVRIPIETNSTHWSQPSWWGSLQYQRTVYSFPKIEGAPKWFPDLNHTAYVAGRLSFFRNQTVVEDHVAGFTNGLWNREEYRFSYQNPSVGLGIGLATRLNHLELFAEGGFNLGTELNTTVYKGILNADGTQTSLESFSYDEQLRFISLSLGLRMFFEHE